MHPRSSHSFPLLLLLASSTSFASAALLTPRQGHEARQLPHQRRADETFLGGWSLRSMMCPTGHEKCDGVKGMPACCPTGSECYTDYIRLNDYVACCPKDTNCVSQIYSLPVCADSSWTLWQPWDAKNTETYGTPFCCLSGQKGYLTTGDRTNPACGEENVEVATSMLATTIATAGATGASAPDSADTTNKSSSDSASDSSSSSSSSSSGLSSGAIGGIVAGTIIGIAVIAAGFWIVFRMGKKKGSASAAATVTAQASTPPVMTQPMHPQQQELDGVENGKEGPGVEQRELEGRMVHGNQWAELEGARGRQ